MLGHTRTTPAPRRPRQMDFEFKAGLGYTGSPCLKTKTNKQTPLSITKELSQFLDFVMNGSVIYVKYRPWKLLMNGLGLTFGWFIFHSRCYKLQYSPPLRCRLGLGFHYDDWYSPSFHKKHAGFLILLSISRSAVRYWQLTLSGLWNLAIHYIYTTLENTFQGRGFFPPRFSCYVCAWLWCSHGIMNILQNDLLTHECGSW